MPCERPLSRDGVTPSGNAFDTPYKTGSHAPVDRLQAIAAQVKTWRDARAQHGRVPEAPETETLAMTGPFDLFQTMTASPVPPQIQDQAQASRDAPAQPQAGLPPVNLPQAGPPQAVVPPVDLPHGDLPQVVVPPMGLPQAVLPQVDLPQATVPQAAVPQAVVPQVDLPQATVPQATVPQVVVPQVVVPQVVAPQVVVPQVVVPQVVAPQVVVPPAALPQVDLPQAIVPQVSLPVMSQPFAPPVGLPQADLAQDDLLASGMPQFGPPRGGPGQSSLPQTALPEVLPETTPVEAPGKGVVRPGEMLSPTPMASPQPQIVDRSKDALQEAAQPRDALAQAGAMSAEPLQGEAGTNTPVKPFDLFHTMPVVRPAETVDPTAISNALQQSLIQMATRLLVSDGRHGGRRVQIEVAEEQLPGVVVDVFEEEGRLVTRFTCSDESSRERLCSGATWFADNLVERLQRDSRVQVQTNDPEDPCLLQVDANV